MIQFERSGGAGFGPSAERAPEAVREDALVSGAMEVIAGWLRGEFEVSQDHVAAIVAGLPAQDRRLIHGTRRRWHAAPRKSKRQTDCGRRSWRDESAVKRSRHRQMTASEGTASSSATAMDSNADSNGVRFPRIRTCSSVCGNRGPLGHSGQ